MLSFLAQAQNVLEERLLTQPILLEFMRRSPAWVQRKISIAWVRKQPRLFASHLKLLASMAEEKVKLGEHNLSFLADTLSLLGWSFKLSIAPGPARDRAPVEALLKPYLHKHNALLWPQTGTDPDQLAFSSQAEAEQGIQDLSQYATLIPQGETPKGPTSLGTVFCQLYPRSIQRDPWRTDWWVQGVKQWWIGAWAWTARSASGMETSGFLLPNYRGRPADIDKTKIQPFWTWAYRSGLAKEAENFLKEVGVEAQNRAKESQAQRTLKGTGTCQACFSNVKLTQDQQIMRHGWQIHAAHNRKYGGSWHSGACRGVGWPPFERSKDLTEKVYLDLLGSIQSVRDLPPATGPKARQETDLRALNLRTMEAEARELDVALKAWVPRPLPGE